MARSSAAVELDLRQGMLGGLIDDQISVVERVEVLAHPTVYGSLAAGGR